MRTIQYSHFYFLNFFKNFIEINSSYMALIIFIFLSTLIFRVQTQQFSPLKPLNRCLGNCAICEFNQLDQCSGNQMIECTKGYDGKKCQLKPSMAVEVKLGPNVTHPLIIDRWSQDKTTKCSFRNSLGQQIDHEVIGLFKGYVLSALKIKMNENYQNFIFSFNLVRSTWAPFSDLLIVSLLDQNQQEIKQTYIQYLRRQQVDPSINILKCNDQNVITEKFQIQIVQGISNISELMIQFESMVFSGQWGITNAKIVAGCNNFLLYEGSSCSKCIDGYYSKYQDNKIVGCSLCPITCRSCNSQNECTQCLEEYSLEQGKCGVSEPLEIITKDIPEATHFCNNISIRTSQSQESLSMISQTFQLPPHQKIRIMAQIADPVGSQKGKYSIELDNATIDGLRVIQPVERIVGYCSIFGGDKENQGDSSGGFYQWTRIITPLMQYSGQNISIIIKNSHEIHFGVSSICFEIHRMEGQPSSDINSTDEISEDLSDNSSSKYPIDINNTENREIQEQTNKEEKDLERTAIMKEIMKVKQRILIDTKSDCQFYFSIKYPRQFSVLPYVYVKLQGDSVIMKPETIREDQSYQIFRVHFRQSFTDKELEIYITDKEWSEPLSKLKNRMLVQSDQELTQVSTLRISRYDKLTGEQIKSLQQFAIVFSVLAWIVIISTIVLTFFSNSILTQELALLLKVIFLHVYIDSTYLPANFKIVMTGLSRIESFNYFTTQNINKIEGWLLGNVVQQSPLRFITYQQDINFTRKVYPILIINICITIWFIILKIIRHFLSIGLAIHEDRQPFMIEKIKFFLIRISERTLGFWYQVWQYQYLMWVWAGVVQLHKLQYPQYADRSSIPNSLFCFSILILFVGLPIATFLYLNKRYYNLDYFEYCYWYKDVFFLKLPPQYLPSKQHRVNILVRNLRLLIFAMSISFFGIYPVATCIILVMLHILSIAYLYRAKLQIYPAIHAFGLVENLGLIVLAMLVFVAYMVGRHIETSEYNAIGYVMIVICLLLTINGFIRAGYYCYHKFNSQTVHNQPSQFKPALGTERAV